MSLATCEAAEDAGAPAAVARQEHALARTVSEAVTDGGTVRGTVCSGEYVYHHVAVAQGAKKDVKPRDRAMASACGISDSTYLCSSMKKKIEIRKIWLFFNIEN